MKTVAVLVGIAFMFLGTGTVYGMGAVAAMGTGVGTLGLILTVIRDTSSTATTISVPVTPRLIFLNPSR